MLWILELLFPVVLCHDISSLLPWPFLYRTWSGLCASWLWLVFLTLTFFVLIFFSRSTWTFASFGVWWPPTPPTTLRSTPLFLLTPWPFLDLDIDPHDICLALMLTLILAWPWCWPWPLLDLDVDPDLCFTLVLTPWPLLDLDIDPLTFNFDPDLCCREGVVVASYPSHHLAVYTINGKMLRCEMHSDSINVSSFYQDFLLLFFLVSTNFSSFVSFFVRWH